MAPGKSSGREIVITMQQSSLVESAAPAVVMYCTAYCPFCRMADQLLSKKGVTEVERIRVDVDPGRRGEMVERVGRTSVPQIFIGTIHVGGYDELSLLERAGKLDALLQLG
ncbi:MAG: glutaredoxin 3 [Burkholderiales bacterium]|nr:glutaredoxin 3 [Burkholderiales bacterium]